MSTFRRGVILLLDVVLLLLGSVAFAIFISGGTVSNVGGHRISMLRAHNPLLALLALLPLRYFAGSDARLSLVVPFDRAIAAAVRSCHSLHDWLSALTTPQARKALLALTAISAIVKLGNAWYYDGFTHGDAVEIHQMTMSALIGRHWDVWDLRSPFYPMVFVYPLQWSALKLGATDLGSVVFTGRLAGVVFSSINAWLTYLVARRWFRSEAIGLIAATLLLVSRLHVRLGSTELPRNVASTFLLLAFLVLISPRRVWTSAVAGALLGLGGALRFGEAVFVVPFVAQLASSRRYLDAVVGVLCAVAIGMLVLGPGDLLFWPEMFHSLRSMIDLSLIQRLSSSGYEPVWSYLRIAPLATNPFTLAFIIAGVAARPGAPALWASLPIVGLSLFQHKEERYLLPVLPFALVCAAPVVWRSLAWARSHGGGWRPAFVAWLLIGATAMELEGFRRRGSEDAVAVARWLLSDPQLRAVAVEDDAAAFGFNLYLSPRAAFVRFDLSGGEIDTRYVSYLQRPGAQYVVLREATVRRLADRLSLAERGFSPVETGMQGSMWRVYVRRARGSS